MAEELVERRSAPQALTQIARSVWRHSTKCWLGDDRGDTITLGDTIADQSAHGPMGAFEVAETRQLLGQAINGLPEREKLVLTLYYYERMTLQEIGMVLGVTESRVCQIHTKAVLHLRCRSRAWRANRSE